MALTQLKTGAIADDAVTTDKLANAINTERTANTAKSTNATHSGEVTGSGALTITDDTVDEANLKISNAGSNGQFLQKQSGDTGGLTWATPTDTNTVTTINNNADNRVITGSGTANTLEGEANLTYNGTDLQLTTDANNEGIKIDGGTTYPVFEIDANRGVGATLGKVISKWNGTQIASINFSSGSDGSNKDDGHMAFSTSSAANIAERMRIDSSGNVGIGESSPDELLHLKSATTGGAAIQIEQDDGTSYKALMQLRGNDLEMRGSSGNIEFFTGNNDGASSTERMRITSDGYVTKSNHPAFCYKKLDNAASSSRMTNDGDLEFDTAIVSSSHYNASNGRFTAPVAGKYFFSISLLLDDNASDGTRYVYLRINDSNTVNMIYHHFLNTGSSKYFHCSGSGIVTLAASDYVTFYGTEGWHVGSESMVSGHFLG